MTLSFNMKWDTAMLPILVDTTMEVPGIRPVEYPKVESSALLKKIHERTTTKTGILPPVVRWISPTKRHVLFERPPQVMPIEFAGLRAGQIRHNTRFQEFKLPLPWTVYLIGFTENNYPYSVHMFGATSSIKDDSAVLYSLPLTNLEVNGKFCIPDETVKYETIAEGINAAYRMIWGSRFNTDIIESINYAYQTRYPTQIMDRMIATSGEIRNESAARLFRAWESFSLPEVLEFRRWARPYFYGQNEESHLRVATLLNFAINEEAQTYTSNHLINSFRAMVNESANVKEDPNVFDQPIAIIDEIDDYDPDDDHDDEDYEQDDPEWNLRVDDDEPF